MEKKTNCSFFLLVSNLMIFSKTSTENPLFAPVKKLFMFKNYRSLKQKCKMFD